MALVTTPNGAYEGAGTAAAQPLGPRALRNEPDFEGFRNGGGSMGEGGPGPGAMREEGCGCRMPGREADGRLAVGSMLVGLVLVVGWRRRRG
ncbi:MAG: MYXO-CTERM sorting domain-containing protein [Myxococcota bacterium]|nr:MYXO-CTERM sorting domain-containing protein [Myxococcota bacterium]MDW8363856.1 MYXO-CTERM sorting domain-containing protein [Myxococcales bacterium]